MHVEAVQQGLAPFGQTATRQAGETTITRAFGREYEISVATTFQLSAAPFELIAAPRCRRRLSTTRPRRKRTCP